MNNLVHNQTLHLAFDCLLFQIIENKNFFAAQLGLRIYQMQ